MSDDDPFACFDDDGSDDDDDDDGDEHQQNNNNETTTTTTTVSSSPPTLIRNPDCGVLAFHRGTEQSLLIFVRNHLEGGANNNTPESVLAAVDTFCNQRHWMMHVGPEKAHPLQSFLHDCIDSRTRRRPDDSDNNKPFILLELGTYCGYSSIFWANALQKQLGVTDFHVYTVEANPEFITVARGLIELAGLSSKISVLHLDILGTNQHLVDLLVQQEVVTVVHDGDDGDNVVDVDTPPPAAAAVDLVFLDHDKDAYLDDLQELEKAGIIRQGVHVAADNVLFARIDTYRAYVQNLSEKGIVQTRLVKGALEYSKVEEEQQAGSGGTVMDFEDGIELTVYIADPPTLAVPSST